MRSIKKRPFSQDFSGESKTQQHFTEAVNVNNIVGHYLTTGVDPYADRAAQPKNFGYASSQDFSEAMRNIADIHSAFAELPSSERAEFSNDASAWLDHLSKPIPPVDEIEPEKASEEAEKPPAEPPEKAAEPLITAAD